MNEWFGKFSGYKTYTVALFGIAAAWGAFLTGDTVQGQEAMSLADTLRWTFEGLLAMAIRHGITRINR